MIYYTRYANNKFTLLNNHGVFIRKEQVESALDAPLQRGRIGRYLTSEKDGIKVIFQKRLE